MGKKKKFGYGQYADKLMRFTTIEQKVSAIRKFYEKTRRSAMTRSECATNDGLVTSKTVVTRKTEPKRNRKDEH